MVSDKDLAFLNRLIIENRLVMPDKMKPFLNEKRRYKFAWGGRGGVAGVHALWA